MEIPIQCLDGDTDRLGECRYGYVPILKVSAKIHAPKLTSMVNVCPALISPPWRYTANHRGGEYPHVARRPNRIKELREKRDLTLQQVADGAGTTLQQIHRLENGSRRLTDEWMRRIAPALGVHPAALLIDFPESKHSLNESIDEALMLEVWRLFNAAERLEVMDTITAIRRRRAKLEVKQKA